MSRESKQTESPDTVHGRLLESVHLSGYSFERAYAELEWLLDGERWRRVAGGFDDVSDFLDTIDFSEFRIAAERRKAIAAKLAEINASNSASARLLGVKETTIRRDLGKTHSTNVELASAGSAEIQVNRADGGDGSTNVEPWFAREIDPAADAKHGAQREQRRADRIERITTIAGGNGAPLDDARPVPVLLADPPWQYEHVKTDSRAIENHYPTMPLDAICALPVADVATPDAVLFLWATSPKLAEAMRVIDAWGFTYRTSLVWVKGSIGMGYYARQQHELLLVATRGSLPTPRERDRPASVLTAPTGRHSAKPEIVYTLIETMYPELERRELFQRGATREGWIAGWGNQAV